MTWYKKSKSENNIGYKIVGFDRDTKRAFSLYDRNHTIDLVKGKNTIYPGKGLFLGNSKKYCLDYFSNADEEENSELMLTYKYRTENILTGDTSFENGEVSVRRAVLVDVEDVTKDFLVKYYPQLK